MSARQELTNTAELGLYGRMWRVLVQYEETTALDVSNLRTVFEIKKNALGQPSIAHIMIYNLAPDTEAQIIKEGFHIQLEAGYAAQYGLIFDGDIIQVFRNREDGINYRLEIIAADGKSFYGGNFIRTTLAAGSNPRDVIEAAAKLAYYPIEIEHVSENLPETTLRAAKYALVIRQIYWMIRRAPLIRSCKSIMVSSKSENIPTRSRMINVYILHRKQDWSGHRNILMTALVFACY